jgi:hypothetical protein
MRASEPDPDLYDCVVPAGLAVSGRDTNVQILRAYYISIGSKSGLCEITCLEGRLSARCGCSSYLPIAILRQRLQSGVASWLVTEDGSFPIS